MDVQAHDKLRKRIREIIAERNQIPEKPSGGFLHLLPMALSAKRLWVQASTKKGQKLGNLMHTPSSSSK